MTATIPRQRGGLSRPAKRAKDVVGRRLLVGAVVVTLLGVLALGYGLVTLLGRDAEQSDAILSLARSSTALSEQVRELGGVPVVTPEQIQAPASVAAPGATGATGQTGATGPAPACLAEPTMCRGDTGEMGAMGEVGPAPPCLAEPTQCRGATGDTGPTGEPGPAPACVTEPAQCRGADGRGVATAGPIRDENGTCVYRTTYTDGLSEDRPTRDENCPPPPEPAEPPGGGMGLVGIAVAISSLIKVPEIHLTHQEQPMGDHALSPSGRPEPVLVLDAVKAIVALLGGFGFLAADDPLVQYGSTGAALLVFVVLTILTRRRVTPMSDAQLADGTPVQELIDRLAEPQLADGTPVREILDRVAAEQRRPPR